MLVAGSRSGLDGGWDMTLVIIRCGASTLIRSGAAVLLSCPSPEVELEDIVNALGKTISTALYIIALVITYLVNKDAVAVVAIVGIVLFFVVHIALRSRQSSSKQ